MKLRRLVAPFLLILMLAVNVPAVHADSGPPWASGLDNLAYTEQEGWKKLDADVTVISDTSDFTEGYIDVAITGATAADNLRLADSGSLTVVGDAVYWNADRVGTIDAVRDGSAGVLRINFTTVVPLTNADFESGDVTGWTVNNAYPGVAGQDWVQSPADDPDVSTADSDPLYDDHSFVTQSAEVQSLVTYEGDYALKLTIGGTVAEGYGTAHGPMVTSTPFEAAEGDQLSVTWYAQQGGDWYDVYGFVIKDADVDGAWDAGESYQTLFHDVGADTGGWITTIVAINSTVAGENLRFVFLNGNYDRSGMMGIGSSLYIDGIDLQLSGTPTVTDAIAATIIDNIEYRNTSDDPPATETYTLSFLESDAGTGFNTAQINITPVNDPPTGITLSASTIAENQPSGTAVGNLTTTGDPDSSTFTYSVVGGDTGSFAINSAQLVTAAAFDYEIKNSYSVQVQTDDGAGGTCNATFAISVNDVGDTTDPAVASVTTPSNEAKYNPSTVPAAFSGIAGDAASDEGGGLNADGTTFTLRRGDGKYWDGNSWEDAAAWLASSHNATSGDAVAAWTDAIDLPAWTDGQTYQVRARATDSASNTFQGATVSFSYDATPPSVSGVTSARDDGAYKAGEVIDIIVSFPEAVYVTGSPYLELETGSTDRQVAYYSGNGTAALTFRYTVQAGDSSADLDYKATDSLGLNGGAIRDAALNDAVLTLASPGAAGSLGGNKALIIDTNNPVAAAITLPAAGATYSPDTMMVQFTGTTADTGGIDIYGGLDANSAAFSLKRGDDKYWDGNSWENSVTWLATSHSATSGNATAAWTDAIDMPVWGSNTYTVMVKAVDRAANILTGDSITFIYDAAGPVVTITDIGEYVNSLTSINGAVADASPGQTDSVRLTLSDNTAGKYWDGDSWEDAATWLDAVVSGGWTYDTNTVTFTSNHAYTVTAKATDQAGNASSEVADSFTYDSISPVTAVVVLPADGARYNASSVPASFSGNVSDDATGVGLPGSSTLYYIKDTTDNRYWDGTSWETQISWLQSSHSATTGGNTAAWSDAVEITWTDGHAYEVKARAIDRAGNTFTGDPVLFTYDTTPPAVSGVTSSTSDGAISVNGTIEITVAFSETVNVAGSPSLELETGATDRNAAYQSGTGSANITFRYIVQAGDASSDLDYKGTASLGLNGGAVADLAGNAAILTLPSPGATGSLGASKALVIDTASPVTASVTIPSDNASYNAASVPAVFSGNAADGTSGSGLDADSVTFYVKDSDTGKYWDGNSWEDAATWLAAANTAASGSDMAGWSANVSLVGWLNGHTYEVKAKSADRAGNDFQGTAVSFLYDTTDPVVAMDDIAASVTSLAEISGNVSDAAPGQVAGVQLYISDNYSGRYWDADSWETGLTWLDAAVSVNWTYDSSAVAFINGHLYMVFARATDGAGNVSSTVTDNFTYSSLSGAVSGGGGGAPPETDKNILAASTEASATDSSGKVLEINGGNITVTGDEASLTIVFPVKLAAGQALGTFTDQNGLNYTANSLTIPGDAAAAGDHGFIVTGVEAVVPAQLILKTDGAYGTGDSAEARVISIIVSTEFTPDGWLPGNAAGAIELELNRLPQAAAILITSLETDAEVTASFEQAATGAGMEDTAIACGMRINKTNIENGADIKNAVVFMKTGADWVGSHGGTQAIRIVRYDDDTGRSEILETAYLGFDEQGRSIFKGVSPGGLSVFGLLGRAAKTAEPPASPGPTTLSPPSEDVKVPAVFTASNLRVAPNAVEAGKEVTVSIDVANTGGTGGVYNLVLKVSGKVEANREVFLNAGARQSFSFSVIRYSAGQFDVEAGGQYASFEVTPEEASEEPVTTRTSNWWLITGIVTALIFIISLMAYLSRRQGKESI